MRNVIAGALFGLGMVGLIVPAWSQQMPQDAPFLQRAIGVMAAQRNQALDLVVGEKARADGLQDDLNKAKARITELELAAKKTEK